MSLPTPPGTSHRDKENRIPRSASSPRVAWAQLNKYHNLASPPRKRLRASASTELPARSILKRPSGLVTAIPVEPERETTPEPNDPLADLRYLEWPVSQIMAPDASLRSLIEAYSVLAARLRSSVQENTDADCSWPLFQPLRKHRQVLVDAMCRDLGRALVDPLAGAAAEDTGSESPVEPEARTALPSPQKSPRKKRGMSAEQVKYARDLCTTTHSVIKLLAFVFTTPAVHHVFNDRDLGLLLTHVLAIPLARSLPTPNARKTCALAIWLIQTQRLPVSVLLPANDRIACALRRAIDGELGKEGKKGSASDGLRAFHELSLYEPAVFVPAFAALLPSVLDNLLAVTLSLRTQACHALSGFALASTRIPQTLVHSHIAECVATFLTEAPEQQSPRKKASPGQALVSVDPVIVRTLRTTLNAHDPPAAAHGPVWALSVMADFIVLLGSALTVSRKLSCILSSLLSLAMRHKKSSVRGLACLLWRCISWTYFRPPLRSPQSEGDGEPDMGVEEDAMLTPEEEELREEYWKVVKSAVDMGAGVGTVGAVLANRVDDEGDIKKVMGVVKTMAQKGTYVSEEAMSILARFVSLDEAPEWDWTKLLPEGLFCSYPGLLTADFMALSIVVRPIIDATPSVVDVRPLTKAELAGEGVIEDLLEVWKEGLHHLSLDSDAALPEEFIASWKGLLTVNVEILQDAENEDALVAFAEQVATILGGILGDSKVVFVPPSRRHRNDVSLGVSSPVKRHGRSNAAMKLNVTRELWDVARRIIPEDDLAAAAEIVLIYLMENEHDLVWETDSTHDARDQWVFLCTELLVRCREATTKIFWGAKHPSSAMKWKWDWSMEVRSYIWRTFVARWKEAAPSKWEGALSLLGVPFA
ncbi:hypothetical protein EWM64_g3098 [Hericium alpestre]|uniref:Telomere-associated protein Rif1 N-terminal domain-containing protein n=1 Tax=Hericium alpestre TaxID=135208 RepID=A0A4Z0A3K4_9AGAM|nr:hypothetical protein EWM64_g3098 [Hericium alpestre]